MSGSLARWPNLPTDLGEAVSRRADELYEVENAQLDERGLIELSVLPLRDVVLFPKMVTPLFVGHPPTMAAIEDAARAGETMAAIAQLDPELENPLPADLYAIGTEVAVGRLMRMPDGSTSVLTQGRRRLEIVETIQTSPYLRVRARPVFETSERTKETVALMRAVLTLFEKCVQLNRSLPEETYIYAMNIEEPGWHSGQNIAIIMGRQRRLICG